MKFTTFIALCFIFSSGIGLSGRCFADTIDEIKNGTREVISDVKEGAVKTGKAAVEMGREVKEGSQEAWWDVSERAVNAGKAVKKGAIEIGRDFKKAFEETKSGIKKETKSD